MSYALNNSVPVIVEHVGVHINEKKVLCTVCGKHVLAKWKREHQLRHVCVLIAFSFVGSFIINTNHELSGVCRHC